MNFKYLLLFCYLSFSVLMSLILTKSNLQFSFMISAYFLLLIKEMFFYLKEKKIFSYITF